MITLKTIDAHAAGEPLRLIVDGFPSPQGRTMLAGADAATAERALASVRAALTPFADADGVHLDAAVWLVQAVAP